MKSKRKKHGQHVSEKKEVRNKSFRGWPPTDLESVEQCLEQILDIEPRLMPVMEEIE